MQSNHLQQGSSKSDDSIMTKKIYLDFNASTPIAPEVLQAMQSFLSDHYGNPSSSHWSGVPAKKAIELARLALVRDPGLEASMGWVRVAMRKAGMLDEEGNVIDKQPEDKRWPVRKP